MRKGRSYTIRGLWLGAALLAGLSGTAAAAELSAEETVELERLLYRLNFDPGEIDGVVDERTHTAIRQYQEFAALTLDGEPSPALLAEMRAVAQVFDEMKKAQSAEQAGQQAAWAAEEKARAAERAAQEAAEQAARVAEEEQARAAKQETQATAQDVPTPPAEPDMPAPTELVAAPELGPKRAEAAVSAPEPEPSGIPVALAPTPTPALASAPPSVASTAPAPTPAPTGGASISALPKPAPTAPPPKAQPEFNLEGVISRLVTGTPAPDKDIRAQPNAMSFSVARAGKAPPGLARKAARARAGARLARKFSPNTLADPEGYKNFKKGYAAAQSGNLKLAIDFYTRAIETGDLKLDHLAGAYYNRANVHHYDGALNFAIQDYSSAILNKPDFPGAYYNRGFAFEANRQHTRAVADFMKARALGLHRLGVRSPDLPPPRP